MISEAIAKNESRINGVNVDELHDTIKAVREQPGLGKSHFRVTNQWVGQALNQSEVMDFFCAGEERSHKRRFVLENDEGEVLLGNDDAPNPVEYVLHALAGCVTTTTVYHAAARGIHIQGLQTTLEGDLDLRGLLQTDPSIPPGYQNITVDMRIKSDASPEELKVLERLFRYSPVFDTLTRAIPVEVRVELAG